MGTARKRPARLGEKLSAVRGKFGYSFAEMAAKLSDAEATILKQDVFRFENGQSDPSLIILLRYSRLAGVPMEIFADDDLDLPL